MNIIALPEPLLSSNMYEKEKMLVSLLSQSWLLPLRTVCQGQHHSSFVLHNKARQTAALSLQEMWQNIFFYMGLAILSLA
jgi:hypothetical protein